MTRNPVVDEPMSPFVLEALEARRPGAPRRDPLVALAALSRGLSRAARRHVERALVRQLFDDGVRDRRRLAAAVAALRRASSEAAPAHGAHELVADELRAELGSGCAHGCRAHAQECEVGDDGELAGECTFAGESDETWSQAEDGDGMLADEGEDERADEGEAWPADEALDESESPFADESAWDGEDEADAPLDEEAEDESADDVEHEALAGGESDEWAGAEVASEDEDPAGWDEVLRTAAVDEEAEDESDDELDDEAFESDAEAVELASELPDAAQIRANLDAIQISTSQVTLRQAPNPFDLNAVASKNTPSKRAVFKALQSTWVSLGRVQKQLAARPKPAAKLKLEARRTKLERQRDEQAAALKAWLSTHALDHSRELAAARADLRAKQRLIAKLGGQKKHAAKVQKLRADVDAVKAALPRMESSLRAAAAAYQPLADFAQNHHRVRVPGASGAAAVSLHDHVVAFATDTRGGLEGSADGDTRAAVQAALQRAPIGEDRRAILRLLSEHEGTFSNVNTWDRAVITFGFIQWTTDAAGDGTLTGLMQAVRDAAPDAYRRCFQRFGMDLGRAGGRRVFKLTLPDGSELLAGAAARHMQTSVKHVAALSAAGLDPDVQAAQLRVAVEGKLDGMLARTVSAGGQSARLRDLLTSEYGVAVLTDRATGTGEPGTRDAAQRGFAAYMKANPAADMSRAVDRQAAGARVLAAIEALDPSRARDYARLSHEPGSFSA